MKSNPFDYALLRGMTKKRWRNQTNFCNGTTHPTLYPYRGYRRGKGRCKTCGAKIGKVKCVFKSNDELMRDVLFEPVPILMKLAERGGEDG